MNSQAAASGIGLLLDLIANAARVSLVVRQAHSEGRDLSSDELSMLITENDEARGLMVDAINRAKSEGR